MVNLKLVDVKNNVELKRNSDTLLITGDGRSLIDDLKEFATMNIKADIASIGRSIKMCENANHWINVDGPGSKWWAEHLPGTPIRHTLGDCEGYDCIWDDGMPEGEPWYGSSSLFAALIGVSLGYKTIWLAGCPMDKKGHWYFGEDDIGPEWRKEDYHAWIEFTKHPTPTVLKSLSGWTKDIL